MKSNKKNPPLESRMVDIVMFYEVLDNLDPRINLVIGPKSQEILKINLKVVEKLRKVLSNDDDNILRMKAISIIKAIQNHRNFS